MVTERAQDAQSLCQVCPCPAECCVRRDDGASGGAMRCRRMRARHTRLARRGDAAERRECWRT
eukprot:181303-Rhodomonas_salina.4